VKFVLDAFPLVVTVGAMAYSDSEYADMVAGYDKLFQRGERYAIVTFTPAGAELPGARDRKRITDWASSPYVHEKSKKLCVASATVVQNALMRGALTAIMWLWKPPAPHRAVGTAQEAVHWCLGQLAAANVAMPVARSDVFAILDAKAFRPR